MKRHKTAYPGIFYREAQRIGGKGTEKVFYILFKRDGKLYEEKIGKQHMDNMTPAKAARIRAARIENKLKSRREVREEKKAQSAKWTVGRLWSEYRENLSGHTLRTDKCNYEKWLSGTFGDKEPKNIIYLDVERLKRSMLKQRSPQTVKHVMTLLTRIINHGAKRNLCTPLPFKVQAPQVNNITTEDLTDKQLRKLIKALDAEPDRAAADIMRMALFTGMRRGELLKLEWKDVDFQRGFIHIRNPKGGKDQVIPMNATARTILERQNRTSDYVFPGRSGGRRYDIKRASERIKTAAGLPKDFRPMHGLRHVYASILASSGKVDMYVLQKLLTHKSPQMTQRYAHLRDEALRKASDIVTEVINE